jgi:hypothetical protein
MKTLILILLASTFALAQAPKSVKPDLKSDTIALTISFKAETEKRFADIEKEMVRLKSEYERLDMVKKEMFKTFLEAKDIDADKVLGVKQEKPGYLIVKLRP